MKTILILCVGVSLATVSLSLNQSDKKLNQQAIKSLKSAYVFVPSGILESKEASASVQAFIMSKTEITNLSYNEFLSDLKKNGELEKWRIAKIDSSLWSTPKSKNSGYESFYHSHPAYRDYPVVNISKKGAELYCEWLSERLKEQSGGKLNLRFRLPTHEEWLYAAKGNLELASYSWGPRLQSADGMQKCNYLAIGAECISRDSTQKFVVKPDAYYPDFSTPNKNFVDVTAPAKSYCPNYYGLYNMNGNVAELISDKEIVVGGSWKDVGYDVRNESSKKYNGSASNVGFRVVATVTNDNFPQSVKLKSYR